MKTVLIGRVKHDLTEFKNDNDAFFIPGGGTYKREDNKSFRARTVQLEFDADQAGSGDLLKGKKVIIPTGLIVLEADLAIPLVGRKVRVTIEDIEDGEDE